MHESLYYHSLNRIECFHLRTQKPETVLEGEVNGMMLEPETGRAFAFKSTYGGSIGNFELYNLKSDDRCHDQDDTGLWRKLYDREGTDQTVKLIGDLP